VEQPFRIIFAASALHDFLTAFGFTGQPDSAIQPMLARILREIDQLAVFPHRNVVANQPRSLWPVRSLPVLPYLVYRRVNDDRREVQIVRVRHGACRPLKRFPKGR
jgi:plasmid stabilization system protein ParE